MTDDDPEILRPDDDVICWHEAGHAVISIVLDRKVDFVNADSCETRDGTPCQGLTSHPPLKERWISVEKLTDEAQIALAGGIAEAKAMGKAGPGDEVDKAKALTIFEVILSAPEIRAQDGIPATDVLSDAQVLFEIYTDKTWELIEEHWDAVTRVAEALLTHRYLTGVQVRRLVKQGA